MLQGSTRFWWCQRTWQITHVTCQSLINKCPETSIYRRKQPPESEGTKQTVRWWIKSKVAIKSKSTRHAFSIDGFSLHFVSLLLFHVGVAVWHHTPPPAQNVRRWSQSIAQVTNDVIPTAPPITIRLHVSSLSLHRMTHSLGQLAPPPGSSQGPFD